MMTVSKVFTLLASWADDADGKALTAPDAFAVVAAHQRAERYRAMSAAIRDALAAGRVPVVAPSKQARKAVASDGPSEHGMAGLARPSSARLGGVSPGSARTKGRSVMDAPSFWGQHGMAVQAIIAVYGTDWKVVAPLGLTELAEIPAKWCSWKGPCGTRITWPRDVRLPSARFWPDGVLPDGVTTFADYERASVEAARSSTHDAAWHEAHGYVWNGKDWVSEIGHRASLAHDDAIAANREEALRVAALERACLEYGPQPEGFRDIYDDDLADAAD